MVLFSEIAIVLSAVVIVYTDKGVKDIDCHPEGQISDLINDIFFYFYFCEILTMSVVEHITKMRVHSSKSTYTV